MYPPPLQTVAVLADSVVQRLLLHLLWTKQTASSALPELQLTSDNFMDIFFGEIDC